MSVGNATLKSVPRSRPEILQASSKHSLAVSDEHHVSDHATDLSSADDRATVIRWVTPPSHAHSAALTQESLVPVAEPAQRAPSGMATVHAVGARPSVQQVEAVKGRPVPQVEVVQSGPRTGSDISPPTPGVDDTPYIRYAIEQLTRDQRQPTTGRRMTVDSQLSYPVEREGAIVLPLAEERPPAVPPKEVSGAPADSAIFIPIDDPNDARYPPLTAKPGILRLPSLALLAVLCTLMMVAVICCAVFSRRNRGLWDYTDAESGRYFVFRFLPQILASILVLYTFSVMVAVLRLMPFVLLASSQVSRRANALHLSMRPAWLMLPPAGYFVAGHAIVAACLAMLWASVFTIPLHSSLFGVRWVERDGQFKWRWVTAEPVAWVLVGLYALLILALVTLALFLFRRRTGLRWDATCLADLIALLPHSNSVREYDGAETFRSRRQFQDALQRRSDRLGYWTTSVSRDDAVFYAVGEAGAPTRPSPMPHARAEKALTADDLEGQPPVRGPASARIRSPRVRHRFVPWYLRDSAVACWIITAAALLTAFLIASFVHHAVQRGFRPLLPARASRAGFSRPGFLYSFLPSLLGVVLFLLWQPIEHAFRALQPFASLSQPGGASAEDSLLLDYTRCHPVEATIKAAAAGHWQLAWISLVSVLSLALPILGGGVFWAIYFPARDQVRMVARMPAFVALVVFLVLYAVSWLVVWPRRVRYLPHDVATVAELVSFFYQSSLLRDIAFDRPRDKIDLVTKLVSSVGAHRRRFAFGIYRGLDGREHLGVDRVVVGVGVRSGDDTGGWSAGSGAGRARAEGGGGART
ncbi:MAG: hypothetical protein M1826_007364 [Phylliscum demangeonii]|nr:MAG: hypothetical protein M1826_007364 [Phylliscum demangeonii]